MRSLGIIMLVLVGLVGAFMVYILMQDTPQMPVKPGLQQSGIPSTQKTATIKSATQPTNSIVGEGDDIWVQQFDPKTERLLSEYRAAHYDPPENGLVKLTQPEFRMYSKDGSVVQINARDGLVVMPEDAGRQDRIDSLKGGQPRSGTLNQVTIYTFENAESTTPSLICTVPVLKFDNDASRINTDITEIDGQLLRADQVPIKVRGEDYDFDGRGLIMRWNQREQRLETLEIAHPERLVVKNPGSFGQNPFASNPVAKPKPPKLAAPTTEPQTDKERRRQKQLAAQRKLEQEQKAQEAAKRVMIAYLATFNDNVVITQDSKPLGTADKMNVRFTFEDQPADPAKTDEPSTRPAEPHQHKPKPVDPKPIEPKPATQSVVISDSPINIRCTGKLTVIPIKYEDSGLKSTKDSLVEFVGSPVTLNHEGSSVVASSIRAGMDGKRFLALGDDRFPIVTIVDPSGTRLTAPSIVMDDNLVTITGKSQAEMVMNDDNGQPQKVQIRWNDKGQLRVTPGENNQNNIDSATFIGGVDVDHPKMKMTGDKITLEMEPGANPGQPDLKAVDASGNVKAVIIGENDDRQMVSAQNFSLGTTKSSNGKSAISSFKASGNAIVSQAKQSLAADDIAATFKPIIADKNSKTNLTQIENLIASGNVSFKAEDGTVSNSELMKIETIEGKQQLTLQGNPASLGTEKNQIKGKIIVASPDGTAAVISGPGMISGVFGDSTAGKKQRPMDISWTESFTYDGVKNIADAVGGIEVKSKSDDGTTDSATGKRLHIVFKDAPKADSSKLKSSMAIGGNKQWQMISLTDEVEISSIQNDPSDASKLLKRIHVFVPLVNIAAADDGNLGEIKVPAGGRMLYENRTISQPKPVDVNDPNPKTNQQAAEMSGATAIQWARSMIYDPSKNNAVIDGDVVVVHKAPDGDPIRMLTQKLIADFGLGADGKTQELKEVRAGGGATFISPSIRFDAADAKYDPANERVIASGSPNQPVEINDSTGASSGSFQEVWWNLKTNRPERLKGVSGSINR